ncbi:MAG: response regulator [Candidatus Rokuibacteriota bacterium]
MDVSVGRRRRPRVLVIEDDARIRELFCEWLDAMDCAADSAPGGGEGLELFDRGSYDLLVTDLMMPGLNGWQVVAAARRRDPALPVIMITGSAANIDFGHVREASVTLLEKPLSLRDFKAAVSRLLGARLARAADPQTSES